MTCISNHFLHVLLKSEILVTVNLRLRGVVAAGLAFTGGLAFVDTTFGVGGFFADAGVTAGEAFAGVDSAFAGVFFTDFAGEIFGVAAIRNCNECYKLYWEYTVDYIPCFVHIKYVHQL